MSRHAVLLTGATGFLGKVVLSELLRRSQGLGIDCMYVLVRPRRGQSAQSRFEKMCASPCFAREPVDRSRVHVLAGDIESENLGLPEAQISRLADTVTTVIHCAASVDFNRPLSEAYRTNTRGALNTLMLSRSLNDLARFVYVSTAYVSPVPKDGTTIREELVLLPASYREISTTIERGQASARALLRRTGHPNTYALTKCLAEHWLTERRGSVDLRIVRPSVISACVEKPFPGWVEGSSGLNGVIRLYGSGVLRTMVFDPDARLDVVPCDHVVRDILQAAFEGPAARDAPIVHSVAGVEHACPLEQVADTVIEHFRDRTVIRRPYPVTTERRCGLRYYCVTAIFHLAPWLSLAFLLLLRGRSRDARRSVELAGTLIAIGKTFGYFSRQTFDFECRKRGSEVQPALYLPIICEGVSTHLIRPLDRSPVE